jgi:predicted transcriptional regulator
MASTPYIGPFLRRHREAAGLSQEALAKAAHITQPYVSQLERGAVVNPSAEVFHALTRALGVASYSIAFAREPGAPIECTKRGPHDIDLMARRESLNIGLAQLADATELSEDYLYEVETGIIDLAAAGDVHDRITAALENEAAAQKLEARAAQLRHSLTVAR